MKTSARLLAAALIAHGKAAATAHRAAVPEIAEWHLRSGCFATDAALVRAFEAAGFERVRRFWRMRIELAGADLAAAAHLSPAHFSREFRRAFGETPHAYLLTRRLERAALLQYLK